MIQHLFFECHYARFLWQVVYLVFGFKPPTSSLHLFHSWSKLGDNKQNYLLLTRAASLCCAIWLTRNDFVLTMVTQEHFSRFYSGGRTDFGSRFNGARMITKIKFTKNYFKCHAFFVSFFASNGWSFVYRLGL